MRHRYSLRILFTALIAAAITGCGKSNANQQQSLNEPASIPGITIAPPPTSNSKSAENHGHKPGAHGGIIVSLGRDSYHVEAIFSNDGVLRLYTLGKDENRIYEVDSQDLVAYVKAIGAPDSAPIELKPEPQQGDSPGKTSQFVGQLPERLWGNNLEVTVPNINISGERFRLGFATLTEADDQDTMPSKVTNDEERDLYLTPGGIYTDADIAINGNITASQKFRGFMSAHDMHPKAGDAICPVTLTKANSKCSWVVGGKTYEFCCPPCVDEFVKLAKSNPAQVKAPQEYVQR